MRLFIRTWNVLQGIASRLVSIFERRNPESLLELEGEKFRKLVGQFNDGLVTHATLAERLKTQVTANEAKARQITSRIQALVRAGDNETAGRCALELKQLSALIAEDGQKLDAAEKKYHYLVQARDAAAAETRARFEQLRWKIGDLKVNRAMADLENMAAAMIGGITEPGDGINRLHEMVTEENDKAKARARVANANLATSDFATRECELDALAAQALQDFMSGEEQEVQLALPDLSKREVPVQRGKRH
jgi:phage shock protein A